MQQRPNQRIVDSSRSRRTQPALPGTTQPTTPVMSPTTPRPTGYSSRTTRIGRTLLSLFVFALVLELLYLALYPLIVAITSADSAGQQVQQAFPALFPWLPSLYWTNALPVLPQLLAHISWLDISNKTTSREANVLLSALLVLFAVCVMLLAVRMLSRVVLERLTGMNNRRLFWLIVLASAIFGLTMLFMPVGLTAFSRDTLVYGLYGHIIVVQHVNPYGVPPQAQDVFQRLMSIKTTTPYGPVWTDVGILAALIAKDSVVSMLLFFRCLGLLVHLTNVVLLWTILTKAKPQMRLWATLLYAWNPLVLLFGIAEMHQELVLVCVVLAALLFFQRNSPTMGWVLVLLGSLLNLLLLPLLPLFFRLMYKQARTLRTGHQLLWWAGMILISLVVFVLAYAPYWHSIGFAGMLGQTQQTFIQNTAINSLDASLLNLPTKSTWLVNPRHWSFVAVLLIGLFLVFGTWLADTLELVALFSAWVLLLCAILLPTYWPWYLILPFTLALCSTNLRTILLMTLLLATSLFSYYWLLTSAWSGQALVSIGVPLLLWGWILFFSASWQMTHAQGEEQLQVARPRASLNSRPSWFSRPSRPGNRF